MVVDDGRGMANAGVNGRGLKNMRTRAERLVGVSSWEHRGRAGPA